MDLTRPARRGFIAAGRGQEGDEDPPRLVQWPPLQLWDGTIRTTRWKWLGHILRMNKHRHPYVALRWTPQGKRKRGRPLAIGTWRKTVEEEMKAAKKTWHEIGWLAQDRSGRRKFVSGAKRIK
ncbi:hypothetical protein Bbelb_245910 [Branchiostoma belcheri]|nr:hypothetical protein Bbelb_245910 [Branchiostoma belcheri]